MNNLAQTTDPSKRLYYSKGSCYHLRMVFGNLATRLELQEALVGVQIMQQMADISFFIIQSSVGH